MRWRRRATQIALVLASLIVACQAFDDAKTFIWDPMTTTWTVVTTGSNAPSARRNVGFAYDPIRSRAVLFGGQSANGPLSDTWEWDGATWTQAATDPTVSGPIARMGLSLVFNPDRGRIVLFGDARLLPAEDFWEWDGTTWTSRTLDTALAPHYRASLAYDAVHQAFVLFGGKGSPSGFPTQLLQYRSNVAVEACTAATLDYDNDGKAGCADEDCWARCNPLCPPGVTCPADAPHCGDGRCSAIEDWQLCPQDCAEPADRACGDYVCNSSETHASCPLDCP